MKNGALPGRVKSLTLARGWLAEEKLKGPGDWSSQESVRQGSGWTAHLGVEISPGGGQEVGKESVPRPLGSWPGGWCGMLGDGLAKTAARGARGTAFLILTLGPIQLHELLAEPGTR